MAGNLVYWKQCFHKVFVNHKNTRLLVDHHVHLLLIYLQTWKVQDNPDDWNPEDFKYHCLQSNGIPRKTLHRNEKAHKPTNHQSGLCANRNDFDTTSPQSGAAPIPPTREAEPGIIGTIHGVTSNHSLSDRYPICIISLPWMAENDNLYLRYVL